MPKINVYLSDDLAAAVREAGVPVSAICQRALGEVLRAGVRARRLAEALRAPEVTPAQLQEVGAELGALLTPRVLQALQEVVDASAPIGTTDILLGVLHQPGNLAEAVLRSLGVDVAALRDDAAQVPGADEGHRWLDPAPPDTPWLAAMSPAARSALASAVEAAAELGHRFLGSEHVVLALAEQADGAAADLLRERGVSPEALRRATPAVVAGAALLSAQLGRSGPGDVVARVETLTARLDDIEARLAVGGL